MPNIRCQATLNMTSGVPEDAAVNVFHFLTDVAFSDYGEISTALATFYSSLRPVLSPLVASSSGLRLKFYDLADPEPRVPVHESLHTLTGTAPNFTMATEVALCVSFQALRVSGQPQARRRGRIYVGPIGYDAAYDMRRPTSGMTDTVRDAAQALLDTAIAAGDWSWGVYSTVDEVIHAIDNGWVDNAWDTQRRRGLVATARDTFVS